MGNFSNTAGFFFNLPCTDPYDANRSTLQCFMIPNLIYIFTSFCIMQGNCEEMNENFQVSWSVSGDSINFQFVGKIGEFISIVTKEEVNLKCINTKVYQCNEGF